MSNPRTFSSRDSAYAGIVATLVNLDTGEEKAVHRGGHYIEKSRYYERATDVNGPLALLAALCHELDALPGNWKIQTISTPNTIYADLKIRKQGFRGAAPPHPEPQLLGQIGRTDMWAGHRQQSTLDERRDTRVDRRRWRMP